MKNLILTAIILLGQSSIFGYGGADYSGNWSLDMKQSKDLPPYYSNVKSHKLSITQDEKRLSVLVDIDAGTEPPARFDLVYNLDGTPTKTESKMRTPTGEITVPTTLAAARGETGHLRITITREVPMLDGQFKGVTTEDWELSPDGKTLTIHKVDNMPRGKAESTMIFVRNSHK